MAKRKEVNDFGKAFERLSFWVRPKRRAGLRRRYRGGKGDRVGRVRALAIAALFLAMPPRSSATVAARSVAPRLAVGRRIATMVST